MELSKGSRHSDHIEYLLASLYVRTSQFVDAEKILTARIRKNTKEKNDREGLYLLLASAYYGTGQKDEAIKILGSVQNDTWCGAASRMLRMNK
jgi:predicted negative regulator of RcsB-dependent stress response